MLIHYSGDDEDPWASLESTSLITRPLRPRNIFNRQNELARLKYASSDEEE